MKLKREALSENHKQYIDHNLDKMPAVEMGRNLGVTIYVVRSYLASKGVEALTPKQWNARMHNDSNGLFNVDVFKGEYTWVV